MGDPRSRGTRLWGARGDGIRSLYDRTSVTSAKGRPLREPPAEEEHEHAGPDGPGCGGDRSRERYRARHRAWAAFGRIDILVNNAGVFPPLSPLVDAREEDVRWVFDVNVMGVWNGCSVFGRRFVDQGSPAHIVNTGSENSLGMAHTGAAAYTASKHAVLGLSDVLRHELPDHVGVSIVCPGMVATRLGSATRNRPARYGGPPAEAAVPASGFGMDPDEVGRLTVEGVRRGDFYIVTHPPVRDIVSERCEEVLGAFDTYAPRFDGDHRLDTRAVMRRMEERGRTGPQA